jgi:hypothetical protein
MYLVRRAARLLLRFDGEIRLDRSEARGKLTD